MTQESRDFAALMPELDERDQAIVLERAISLRDNNKPQVGDFVVFADGVERRVSHVWDWPEDANGPAIWSIQTSDGGSWYLGNGYVSFSGGLFMGVPGETLTGDPCDIKDGSVWIFHHDYATAGGGVHSRIAFRVWHCSENARSI